MALQSPYKWVLVDEEEKERRRGHYQDGSKAIDVASSVPKGFILPKEIKAVSEKIYNFELRPDDTWIVTYPKCGTTWTQEIVYQILNGVQPEMSRTGEHMFTRSPFLEYELMAGANPDKKEGELNPFYDSVEYAAQLKSPRVIKTHLFVDMLPPRLLDTCKVIYVCRNVKDVCISFYYHALASKQSLGFKGTFQQYFQEFTQGTFIWGDYWAHLRNGLKHVGQPNFMFVWYEDMKLDQQAAFRKFSNFLGKPLSQEQIEQLTDHVSLDNMRELAVHNASDGDAKERARKHYRKGQVGDWETFFKDYPEEAKVMDQWIEKNLADLGIDMKFT